MTGEMVALTILYIVCGFATLIIGMILGAFFMAAHVGKALDNATRKLLAPPPLSGDEWKESDKEKKDEDWLRRHLGDDKDPEAK